MVWHIKKVFFLILTGFHIISILTVYFSQIDKVYIGYILVTLLCYAFYCLGYRFALANILPFFVEFISAAFLAFFISFVHLFDGPTPLETVPIVFAFMLPVIGFIYALVCARYNYKTKKRKPPKELPPLTESINN